MKTLKFCSVILLCLSFSTYGINSSFEKELNNELEAITKEHGIPALSVAVITAGKIIYAEGFGFQDEENNVPVTRNTLFRVASISKLFTAQAVMQLVEKKELSIDDKISKYLPEFKVSNITVGQLLTHSSGLRDRVRPVSPEYKRSLSSYLKLVSSSLENDVLPGTFNYSDTGFNLLGAIVSAVSKLPFDDYIKRNILIPSNMSHSGYFDGQQGIVADVEPTYKGSVISRDQQRPYDVAFFPSEGLVSSTEDLSRWAISTLTMKETILSKNSFQQMYVPHIKTVWGDIFMGLGWQVYRVNKRVIARHPGSIRGYKSLIVTYPEDRSALILLTNASNAPRFEIEKRITEILRSEELWK